MQDPLGVKPILLHVPIDLYVWLKTTAQEERVTMRSLILDAIVAAKRNRDFEIL